MGRSLPRIAVVFLAAHAAHGTAASDVIFIASFGAEPPEVLGIVAAHNSVRAAVGVGPIFWDESLAATAQAWANSCTDVDSDGLIDHNPNRSDGYPWDVGENIAASLDTITTQLAIDVWAGEVAYYDYASNSCAPDQTCLHYTQVVWANSVRLGCAVSSCAALTYRSSMVCDYGPAGNYIGQWPY